MIFSADVESALIAVILKKPELYLSVSDMIQPEQFGWDSFGDVWRAIKSINDSGLKLDSVTLGDTLERAGKLKDFCLPNNKQFYGRAALAQIRETRTSIDSIDSYCHTILDYDAKRKLVNIYTSAVNQSMNGRTASDIVADVETASGQLVLHGKVDNHTYDMPTSVERALNATNLASTGVRVLLTGIVSLDDIINVQKGELITVAAPTGQGKTALLATIVLNSARQGKRWQVFALEGGATRFTQRLLSQISNIEAWRIMNGKIQEHEGDAWVAAQEELRTLPIWITDIPNIKIGQIRSEARKRDVDALAVDYVQLASSDKRNERRDLDIGEVTRGLSALAVEKDIPIFQAAQIDRGVEKRSDRKPMISDLRESGSIENDSATVIMLYRPDAMNEELVDLMVLKHRHGKQGVASARFTPGTMKFSDVVTQTVTFKDYVK